MRRSARRFNRSEKSAYKHALSALLLAAVVGQTCLPVLAKEMPLRGQVGINRLSPPQSGVRLLEDIFQRVRSAPQVALAKNLKLQVAAQNDMQQGLQIRPPKPSPKTVVSQAPTLALLPPSAAPPRPVMQDKASGALRDQAQGQFADSLSNAFGGSVPGGGGGAGSGSATVRTEPAAPVPESWLGSRQYPMSVVERKAASAPQGMWEARGEQDESEGNIIGQMGKGRSVNVGAKPRKVQPPDLASAVSRLYGATKATEEMQKLAQSNAPSYAPRQRADNGSSETASFKQDARRTKAEAPSADGGYNEIERSSGTSLGYSAGSAPAAPPPPVESRAAKRNESPVAAKKVAAKEKARTKPAKDAPRDADSEEDSDALIDRKIAWSPNIALRAPSVATGIPQANIRLGMSESNASSAIKILGSMKREKVDKWTVWSWDRTPSRIQTALQLYMRNGLLDAMRVFDPTLVAPDFGVTMGDNLARVKEKFGEPAFILQEPGPGAGQNYIYPISQVGFQLARPAPDQEPRVVSVLIFNVK